MTAFFVLMQYFADLRDNPKFEGNYINAKMVKAFV